MTVTAAHSRGDAEGTSNDKHLYTTISNNEDKHLYTMYTTISNNEDKHLYTMYTTISNNEEQSGGSEAWHTIKHPIVI